MKNIIFASLLSVIILLVSCKKSIPSNNPPHISSLTANPTEVEPNGSSSITCTASDPDGDVLTYVWSATSGSINGSGNNVTWIAPNDEGTCSVTCEVRDGKGGQDSKFVIIPVVEDTCPELNCDNNVGYFSIHIGTPSQSGPDLIVEGIASPQQHHVASPSGAFTIDYRIHNMGMPQGSASPPSIAKIYFSNDRIPSTDDVLIKEVNVGSITVGSYESISTSIQAPSGYSDSYYFIVVVADADNQMNELNENNNYNSFSLHIGTPSQHKPDLTVEGLVSPQHHVASPSGAFTIDYRIHNMGMPQGSASPPSVARIYFSNDQSFSVDDVFIKEVNVGSIPVGFYESISTSIQAPSGYSDGYYYILVKAKL